jgi:hypothetical protein
MAQNGSSTASPGNEFAIKPFPMQVPHLDFLYRLECEMAKENDNIRSPFDGSGVRIIMPIIGGTVRGPKLSGTIQHRSGADWGMSMKGTDVSLAVTGGDGV